MLSSNNNLQIRAKKRAKGVIKLKTRESELRFKFFKASKDKN